MRLLTRSDFDGLVCAVLLKEAGIVDEYGFVHPRDIQDGKIKVTDRDVLANIPYVPGCGLWFDHHHSELERMKLFDRFDYNGRSEMAPSCARVIYDYYGGAAKFSRFDESGLMEAVDKCDSGQLSYEDIVHPKGWILLSFIMDPRTGLGRYKDYRISNYMLMEDMIDYCSSMTAADMLQVPDVKERTERYFRQEEAYENMLSAAGVIDGNVLLINLLDIDPILPGNRFKEYVLFPEQNASIRIIWGYRKKNVVLTCGHNILNQTLNINIGSLLMKYGGGGHPTVGTCQVPVRDWQRVKDELLCVLKNEGKVKGKVIGKDSRRECWEEINNKGRL
jgi:nanoRNase/pAp phosphatase (c-di-AMP/oligoRNAs hydrolase)